MMASSPIKRARREAREAAEGRGNGRAKTPRAKKVDVTIRRVAVERAATIGDVRAGAEVGVTGPTVRSWRRRLKNAGVAVAGPTQGESTAHVLASAESGPPTTIDASRIAEMEATLSTARTIVAEAGRLTRELQRAGNHIGSREQSAAASQWSKTITSLESALALAKGTSQRLTDDQGKRIGTLINDFCSVVGVPRTAGVRKVLRALLEAGEDGSDLNSPHAERARQEVREHFRQALATELAADAPPPSEDEPEAAEDAGVAVEPEPPTPPVAEESPEVDSEPDDGLPPWDELPNEWKEKYKLQPHRGRHEYANTLRREEMTRDVPPAKPSRYGGLSHPGLR